MWTPESSSTPESPKHDEVDHLMRNALLRDELEPLFDESIGSVNARVMSTHSENEFSNRCSIGSERRWFRLANGSTQSLTLPPPDRLDAGPLLELLESVADQLYEKHIVLDFTNHLTDRQLYRLIYRDILPTFEKKALEAKQLPSLGLCQHRRRPRNVVALLRQR